jgi:hypothetical protein
MIVSGGRLRSACEVSRLWLGEEFEQGQSAFMCCVCRVRKVLLLVFGLEPRGILSWEQRGDESILKVVPC